MCGIAGILTRRADFDLSAALERMQTALRHRGPDDEGQIVLQLGDNLRLGLAHTRLAILDLSPAGHQPMCHPESDSWITFNGEIYNHASLRGQLPPREYRSTSDTETLLHAWSELGSATLEQLRGIFAFAHFDRRRQTLSLVRDQLGVKPLYAARTTRDDWVFASEVRAVLASGLVERKLNPHALRAYFAFGCVVAPWTLIEGLVSLLPGEHWEFDLRATSGDQPRRRCYWQPPFQPLSRRAGDPDHPPPGAAHGDELRNELVTAVNLQMLADVPVGVFLSGGIDSSSLVATLAHSGHRLHTFAVAFDEGDFDESPHARVVAEHFGAEHTELRLRPASILEQFETALESYDQPSVDGLNTYFISRAVRQAGITVALSGLGGDELFAGYPDFRRARMFDRGWTRGLLGLAARFGQPLLGQRPQFEKLRRILSAGESRLDRYLANRTMLATARFTPPFPPELRSELSLAVADLDPINAHSRLELAHYLPNVLLRDSDQMSMAHGLELRVPLLDHHLVERVAAIPGPTKLRPGRTSPAKGLLTDSLPVPLPTSVVSRRKMGFVLPWETWLRGPLRSCVTEVLTDRSTCQHFGLPADWGTQLVRNFQLRLPGPRYTDLLALTTLYLWCRRHQVAACTAVEN